MNDDLKKLNAVLIKSEWCFMDRVVWDELEYSGFRILPEIVLQCSNFLNI